MRTSCIAHPGNEPLVMIRQWQVEACGGNHCAAALLNYFEYWHNIRIDQASRSARQNQIAEMHGDEGVQDTSLLQFHSEAEIEEGILSLYGKSSIGSAIKLLEKLGFISVHRNPNPRYKFDKTRYFLLLVENVNRWLKNRQSRVKNNSRQTENDSRQPEINEAIKEITSEITSEITERDYSHTGCNGESSQVEPEQPNSSEPEQVTSNCSLPSQSGSQPAGRTGHLEDQNSAAPNFSEFKPQSSFISSAERHERQFKPLPPWMESKRRAHAGFAEYIRKNHLMRVSSFQGNPTIADAHSWIIKGVYGDEREIQVELQWEAYQESLRVAAEREAQRLQQAPAVEPVSQPEYSQTDVEAARRRFQELRKQALSRSPVQADGNAQIQENAS